MRPSVFLIGQLPFAAVITRGRIFHSFDMILIPVAQTSFNLMMGAAFVGGILGIVAGSTLARRASEQ